MSESKVVTAKVPQTNDEKLDAGWQWVTIPSKDIYGYPFTGMYLNLEHFKPGKHLVPANVAEALEERLARFQEYSIRLMRPDADRTTLNELVAKPQA